MKVEMIKDDDDMITIPAIDDEPFDDDRVMSHQEQFMRLMRDTTAETSTKMSYFLRELRDGLPDEMKPGFREIVGAVLIAHSEVIRDSLQDDNEMFMDTMADQLAERALDVIHIRRDTTSPN